MAQRLLLVFSLAAVLLSVLSCAAQRSPIAAEQPQAASGRQDDRAAAEEVSREPSATAQVEEAVFAAASVMREEGLLSAREGDLEEAREALDEALNAILGSRLALDAHPRLYALFEAISQEAISIDDLLAGVDEEPRESTLADELASVEEDESVGESEEAPPAVTYDLPVVLNNRVRYFIERFQGERREVFAEGLARSGRYLDMFKRIMREEGVPTDLAYMPQIESSYKVRAYSRASAKGIWQFMSWTGRRYGLRINSWVDERSDPEMACRAAARYLRDLHDELGDWLLAIAAYNGGPGRVGRGVRSMRTTDFWTISGTSRYLRRETRNFVPAILAAIIMMKQPQAYGFGDVQPDDPIEYEIATIDSPTDLHVAAELAGVSVETLQELNPSIRRMVTPVDYTDFRLRLPPGTGEAFERNYAALPPQRRLRYTEHVVRRGETLSVIARRHGTTVAAIQRANNIANPHRLSLGQHLIVPLSQTAGPAGSSSVAQTSGAARGTRVTHRVQRGESLYRIARAYRTTIDSIARWNDIDPRRPIHPGQRLTIVVGTRIAGGQATRGSGVVVHSVRRGDTLYDIAMHYNISVAQLKRWNNLRRNLIRPGDRLTIYLNGGEEGSN